MLVYINTTEKNLLKFALINKKSEVFLFKKEVLNKQSENMTLLFNKFLKKNKVKLDKLEKIIVNRGPGSFTSVRIGVVLANTLSYSLKIPVIGIDNFMVEKKEDYLELLNLEPKEEFIKPFYYKEANITKSKSEILNSKQIRNNKS